MCGNVQVSVVPRRCAQHSRHQAGGRSGFKAQVGDTISKWIYGKELFRIRSVDCKTTTRRTRSYLPIGVEGG